MVRSKAMPRQAGKGPKVKKKPMTPWDYGNAVKVSGVVLTVALFISIYFNLAEGIQVLSPDDPESLRRVFFSGEPWAVYCSDDTSAPVPEVFELAASSLHGISAGLVNCNTPLPSGKSILQRFNLKKLRKDPTIFVVANGGKPTQILGPHLSSASKLSKKITELTAKSSALVGSNRDLQKHCFSRKICGMILSSGKLSGQDESALQSIMTQNRDVAFVRMDSNKYAMSVDRSLPPRTQGYARFVVFVRSELASTPTPASGAGGTESGTVDEEEAEQASGGVDVDVEEQENKDDEEGEGEEGVAATSPPEKSYTLHARAYRGRGFDVDEEGYEAGSDVDAQGLDVVGVSEMLERVRGGGLQLTGLKAPPRIKRRGESRGSRGGQRGPGGSSDGGSSSSSSSSSSSRGEEAATNKDGGVPATPKTPEDVKMEEAARMEGERVRRESMEKEGEAYYAQHAEEEDGEVDEGEEVEMVDWDEEE